MSKLSLVAAQQAAEVSEAHGDLRAALNAVEQAGLELAARARSLRALGTSLHGGEPRRGEFARRFDAYQDALNQALAAQTTLRRLRAARGGAAAADQAGPKAEGERGLQGLCEAFAATRRRSSTANRTHANPSIL
jgi:hypothetical protein